MSPLSIGGVEIGRTVLSAAFEDHIKGDRRANDAPQHEHPPTLDVPSWMTAALILAAGLASAGREWITPEVRAPGVEQYRWISRAAQAEVSYHLFLPPEYTAKPNTRFPVLIWLHGSGGGLAGIRPVSAWFADAMKESKMPPSIIVFPNSFDHGMWCNAASGKQPLETMIIRELIPEIDRRFRTLGRREGRRLEGFSMGGYGAARFAFKYPELFAGVSMLGAGPLDLEFKGPRAEANPALRQKILDEVFGGSIARFQSESPWRLAESRAESLRSGPALRLIIGERDFTLPANRTFSAHLQRLGISHTFEVPVGVGHDALALLRALGEDNWAFYQLQASR